MELILIKNKGAYKVFSGVLDYHEEGYHFFATVVNGKIQDLVAYTIDETTNQFIPVPEYTKGALFDILVDEYIESGVK